MTDQSNLPQEVAAESPAPIKNASLSKGGSIAALVPQSLDDTFRLAKALSMAGDMVPQHFQGRQEATMAAIVRGMEIGLAPMQALSNIAVINGRACIWGDAIPAIIQRAGHHIDVEIEGEGDSTVAIATLERGDTGKVITRRFSVDDAKKANLWGKKGPWQQYPRRMLAHRARGWVARDGAADALMGLQIAEEVSDYAPPKDITPQTGGFAAKAQAARETPQEPTPAEDAQVLPDEPENAPETQESADPAPIEGEIVNEFDIQALDLSEAFPGSDEFTEGVKAFEAGMKPEMCPYKDELSRATDWVGGFFQAKANRESADA